MMDAILYVTCSGFKNTFLWESTLLNVQRMILSTFEVNESFGNEYHGSGFGPNTLSTFSIYLFFILKVYVAHKA